LTVFPAKAWFRDTPWEKLIKTVLRLERTVCKRAPATGLCAVAKAAFDAAFDAAIAAAMATLECAEPDPQAADTCNAVKAAKAAYDATLAAVDAAMADLEAAKAKCDAADAKLIGDDPIPAFLSGRRASPLPPSRARSSPSPTTFNPKPPPPDPSGHHQESAIAREGKAQAFQKEQRWRKQRKLGRKRAPRLASTKLAPAAGSLAPPFVQTIVQSFKSER
jgi:hypothetical protein